MDQKKYLIAIVGPTAVGKTALAIELARFYGSEIISYDSRQFFKEMKIGTAVPTTEELEKAPHHFIQNKSIFDTYSVGEYEREVLPLLDELFKKNPIQIAVGGSGLYIDALIKGFDNFPEIPEAVRQMIEDNYDLYGISFLQNTLQEKDPEYYQKLKTENPQTLSNPQRTKRFVAVCMSEGLPYSSYLNKSESKRNFTPVIIGLDAPREALYDRINHRVDRMLQQGLLKEAELLYPDRKQNALQTVGYRELFSFFDGECELPFAIEDIKKNTRRFAKRQLTWFRRNENTTWFDYQTPPKDIISHIQKQISE